MADRIGMFANKNQPHENSRLFRYK